VNNKIDGDFVIKEIREQCTMHNLDKLFKMFGISKRQVSDMLGVKERVLVRWIEKGEYEQERYERIVKTLMKIIQSIICDYDCR
jgi:predicted transcriptional regulator